MEGKLKNQPRKGWAKQFKKMQEAGDDKPLIPYFFEDKEFLTGPKAWIWPEKSEESKKHP